MNPWIKRAIVAAVAVKILQKRKAKKEKALLEKEKND